MREAEKSGSSPKDLANELRDFYNNLIKTKCIVALLLLALMVPLSPAIMTNIAKGNASSIITFYLLAIKDSISFHIIMTMDLPFIFAGFTLTYGGLAMICISCQEYFELKRIARWSNQIENDKRSASKIESDNEGCKIENSLLKV